MELGEIGVWTVDRLIGTENVVEAAKLAEDLGFSALWLGGSPRLPDMRPALAAAEQLIVATGIVNVWHYEPEELAAERAELAAEFPGRLLLGIGIGHREQDTEYKQPLATMREFCDGLDAASSPVPHDELCISALGPKMLELSRERSLGTHPYFVPVEHSRYARERLGDGPLIAPEVACVIDTDAERARATARGYVQHYFGLSNYTNNLLRLGYTEGDFADGGSDRLVDAVVPQGSAEQIAEVARAHLDAGASHVCLQPIGVEGLPREQWTALAKALL